MSHVNKKMFAMIEHNLALWKRLFIESCFTRTKVIEPSATDLNKQSPQIVTKDLFKNYITTRRSLSTGCFHEELELPSSSYIAEPKNSSSIPSLMADEAGLSLLIWDEASPSVSHYLWPADNSLRNKIAVCQQPAQIQLAFDNSLVVVSSSQNKEAGASSFIAVAHLSENQLKPLWHQDSPSPYINWWVSLTGNKLFRLQNSLIHHSTWLEILSPTTGEVTKSVPTPFRSYNADLISWDESWIAMPGGLKILLVNVRTEEVRYLDLKTQNPDGDNITKVLIRNGLVIAMTLSNCITAIKASNGDELFSFKSEIQEPLQGLTGSAGKLLAWSKSQMLALSESFEIEKYDLSVDTEPSSVISINKQGTFLADEVYHDIVGIQLVQNVAVICFTINNIKRDTCEIKLAFLPRKMKKFESAAKVTVGVENSSIRPEMVQLMSTSTSVIVNIPSCSKMIVYNFFQRS